MSVRLVPCANCGSELDPATGRCRYCSPGDPQAAAERERAFGLLLFEAEETLARGGAEKAMVLASRAVKERPESLTARSLVERARRELLRGRRREKLEARIDEARELIERGELPAAERIVTSALKLVPDHAAALALFARLKQRRATRVPTVEAETEHELERLARGQARKSLEAARAALANGWERRALVHVRRGLRRAPDDPELLALLKRAQGAAERADAARTRRRALSAQVRAGLERLAEGRLPESLRLLRAVLLEDPDNARAQAAIQELRRAFLAQRTAPAPAPPAPAPPAAPAPKPVPAPRTRAAAADAVADASLPFVPLEILLPRTRRHRTPTGWIAAGAMAVVVGLFLVAGRSGHAPVPAVERGAASPAASRAAPEPGPLDGVDPELRAAVEATLRAYARALEAGDSELLQQARPDLPAEAREERLRPFRGALNASADLRVLDARAAQDRAEVELLRTDVIVGGPAAARPPEAETLSFERRGGAWFLAGARLP